MPTDAQQPAGGQAPTPAELVTDQQSFDKLVWRCAGDLAAGQPRQSIVAGLIDDGWSSEDAEGIATRAEQLKKAEVRGNAVRSMVIGGGLLAFGGIITTGTWAMSRGGGIYIVTWGLIAVGAWVFLRGVLRYTNG